MSRAPLGRRLRRSFFDRPAEAVAEDLIGALFVRSWNEAEGSTPGTRRAGGMRLVGRIVEVEAYRGDGSDPASHSHRGPTERNAAMFGPPAHLYAYRSYGIHTCVNVVCQPEGRAEAVLLRAVEPLEGLAWMRRLRGLPPEGPERAIASGPGRLAQAFGLDLGFDGRSLLGAELALHAAPRAAPLPHVARGPRVGISRAAALPLRFWDAGSRCVSPFRAGRAGKRARTQPPRQ